MASAGKSYQMQICMFMSFSSCLLTPDDLDLVEMFRFHDDDEEEEVIVDKTAEQQL